jgi:hypothetical protein
MKNDDIVDKVIEHFLLSGVISLCLFGVPLAISLITGQPYDAVFFIWASINFVFLLIRGVF